VATAVLPPAADAVSAAVAAIFSEHGAAYQALAAEAAAFHEQFVRALTAGAESSAGAEAVRPLIANSGTGNVCIGLITVNRIGCGGFTGAGTCNAGIGTVSWHQFDSRRPGPWNTG
jgi:hypothetical protein